VLVNGRPSFFTLASPPSILFSFLPCLITLQATGTTLSSTASSPCPCIAMLTGSLPFSSPSTTQITQEARQRGSRTSLLLHFLLPGTQ